MRGPIWSLSDLVESSQRSETVVDRNWTAAALREAFEHAAVATALVDPNHHFLTVNPAFARLLGYSEAELAGMTVGDVVHPDDREECLARRELALQGVRDYVHVETRYSRKEGHVVWGLTNVTPVRDSMNRPSFYVHQIQDVTEQKRVDESLRLAQRRLQLVAATSPAVHCAFAADGHALRLTWVSENVRGLTGDTAEEALRPGWWQSRLHPEEAARVLAEVRELFFARDQLSHEYRFRNCDGTFRWVRGEMCLRRTAAGAPDEGVGSWSDVTERRHLEGQYRQAQKLEAVGRLAGGVAHDFNNLLTVINGYGELVLAQVPEHDPIREYVAEIVAAGERAAGLTRQLLAFCRQAVIEPQLLDLRVAVAEIETMLQRLIGENVRLTVAGETDVGLVLADPVQVHQVVMNVVINARDAMPRGGQIAIDVRNVELDEAYAGGRADARPGPHVRLAVRDTGCGMDADTLAHLFEPFFTTKGRAGTGLGLATVHDIVCQSGGHVAVASEVGAGTTVSVYFPRAGHRTSGEPGRASPDALVRGRERILLVEDEDGVRALARHVLQECGYTVIEAQDGADAIRLADHTAERIDLLVTDLVLPLVDGREVARHLTGTHPGRKVLFISGYDDESVDGANVADAGVAFLRKPFTPAALAAKVREVLGAPAR